MEECVSDVEDKVDRLQRSLETLQVDTAVLKSSIGDVSRGLADMRTDIRELRSRQERDFRRLFGSLITVAGGLGAVMAKGFGWLH